MPASAYMFRNVAPISRGAGQSAIAKAAYNAREALTDEKERDADYAIKNYSQGHSEVLFSAIFAPKDAPDWVHDRQRLWNSVEQIENRKNSQLAQEIELTFPHQLNEEQREWLIKDFVRDKLVRPLGVVADVNIHAPDKDSDQRNYHAHILFTLRGIGEDGWNKQKNRFEPEASNLDPEGPKTWQNARDNRQDEWKEYWAERGAKVLERAGFPLEAERWRVGHLDKEDQRDAAMARGDIEFAAQIYDGPSVHLGPKVARMEADGIKTELGDELRQAGQTAGGPKVILREAYEAADNAQAFQAAIAEKGFVLARASAADAENNPADRMQHYQPKFAEAEYVAVNEVGHAYRLNFYKDAERRGQIEEFLKPLDGVEMKDVADTRADLLVAEAERTVTPRPEREAESKPFTFADAADTNTKDKGQLNEVAGNIRLAYALSQGPEEFQELTLRKKIDARAGSFDHAKRGLGS